MIQTTTPYNLQWINYGKSFFKSQAFFKRALCSLDYIPACPAYRQAGAGRDYERITQITNQSIIVWAMKAKSLLPSLYPPGQRPLWVGAWAGGKKVETAFWWGHAVDSTTSLCNNGVYYQLFKDPKTGKWVPVVSPFYEEKRRLKAKIEATQAEIKSIQEKLLQLMRSLWKIIICWN